MSDQLINTRITADIAQAEQGIRTIKRDLKSLGDEARDLISPVNMVKTALASLGAWSGIQGVKSIVDAALAMERLNTQFKVINESAILGAAEMRYVTAESKRLGQELVVLASAYSRLMQATKGSKFEGAPTKAMFSGFSEAFTALKMTSDQMSGVWLQINQGMMKGKIQLEDVNIIAERGLNIIKLLEISTGKSSKELMEMIGKSKLTADEYMKLGPLLSQIYGGAAKSAAQELQGSINNFSTEFMKLKASIGADFTPAFSSMLKTITENMTGIVETIKNLGIAMTAVFSGRLLNSFATKIAATNATLAQSALVAIPGSGVQGQSAAAASKAALLLREAQAHEAVTAATLSSARATDLKRQVDLNAAQAEMRKLMIMESSGAVMANDLGHMANKARATVMLTNAQNALTTATAATTLAQEANTIASNVAALAQQRAAAMTTSATISGRALAAATWAVEGATKAAGIAFNAIGGWIGVVIIAITTAVMWWNSYKKAKEDALKARPEATTELDVIQEQIKLVQKEIAVLRGDKKALGIIDKEETDKTIQNQMNRIATAQKALEAERAKKFPNQDAIKQLEANRTAAEDAVKIIASEMAKLKELKALKDSLNKQTPAPVKPAKAEQKHVEDLTSLYHRLADAKRRYDDELTNEKQSIAKNAYSEQLANLEIQHEKELISTRGFLDKKAQLEKEYADKNIAALESQWFTSVAARQTAQSQSSVYVLSPKARAEREIEVQQSLTDEVKKRGELETAISNEQIRLGKISLDIAKEETRQAEIRKRSQETLVAMNTKNDGTAASLVGTNAIGGFDSIADQTANALAIQKAAHQERLDMIETEYQKQKEAYDKGIISHDLFTKHQKAKSTAVELEKRKDVQATGNITANSYKQQLGMAATYTGMAGQMFSALAGTIDQSSRSGFESAKALNLAAAVVSTAAAIMNQMAGGDPYTAWARAAMAGVMGAIQIATIASTSFGGGATVPSVPSGSFGGGATGSGAGGGVQAPIQTVRDSQTASQLDTIASSMDNAALAMGKAADSFLKIGEMMKSGGMDMLMRITPGKFTQTGNPFLAGGNTTNALGISKSTLLSSFRLDVGTMISNSFKALFGGSWATTDAGLTMGLSGGNMGVGSFEKQHKDGGWFGRSGDRYLYGNNVDPAFQQGMAQFFGGLKTDMLRGVTAFGLSAVDQQSRFNQVSTARINVSTAGRKPEDIQKDVEAAIQSASDALAKTIPGLAQFALGGELATETLQRLSSAMLNTNYQLGLIGANLIPTNGAISDAAYRLETLMGGAQAFADAVDTYFTTMFTEQEQAILKAEQAQRNVNLAFSEMGREIPKTKAEFVALVNSLNLSSDAGAQTFAALMNVADSFGVVQDQIAKLAETTANFSNDLTSREMTLAGLVGGVDLFELRIQQEKELQQARLDGMDTARLQIVQSEEWAAAVLKSTGVVTDSITKMITAAKKALTDMLDAQINIVNTMRNIVTGPLAGLSPEAAYRQAQAKFASLQGKNDLVSLQALPDAANALLNASKAYNASGSAYQADLANVLEALRIASGGNGTTLEAIDLQLEQLKAIKKAIDDANILQLNALTGLLGPDSTLAALIGTWSSATAEQLQREKEAAARETRLKLDAAIGTVNVQTAAMEAAQAKILTADGLTSAQATIAQAEQGKTWSTQQQQAFQTYLDSLWSTYRAKQITGFRRGEDVALMGEINTVQGKVNTWQNDINYYANVITEQQALIKSSVDAQAEYNRLASELPVLVTAMNNLATTLGRLIQSYDPLYTTSGAVTTVPALPSFAVGSPYLPYDMTANVHQGEIIMDRASSDVLRKYGIPIAGSADNRELVEEVRELKDVVNALLSVTQYVGGETIELGKRQERNSEEIARRARLA